MEQMSKKIYIQYNKHLKVSWEKKKNIYLSTNQAVIPLKGSSQFKVHIHTLMHTYTYIHSSHLATRLLEEQRSGPSNQCVMTSNFRKIELMLHLHTGRNGYTESCWPSDKLIKRLLSSKLPRTHGPSICTQNSDTKQDNGEVPDLRLIVL